MAKKAQRREWTKDDIRELKTLARQNGATSQKAFTLGVSLDTRA